MLSAVPFVFYHWVQQKKTQLENSPSCITNIYFLNFTKKLIYLLVWKHTIIFTCIKYLLVVQTLGYWRILILQMGNKHVFLKKSNKNENIFAHLEVS
jgi:hypothetical protein